jgi:hypothetical protein
MGVDGPILEDPVFGRAGYERIVRLDRTLLDTEHSMNPRIQRFLVACLVGGSAVVGTIEPARAAAYVGAWDPTYGAPFNNLGWSGTATFQVPASPVCGNVTGNACIGGAFVQDAQVVFYDIGNPSVALATINWTTAQLSGLVIDSLAFDGNGVLQEVDTSPTTSASLPPNPVAAFNPANYGNFTADVFSLQFLTDQVVGNNPQFSGPLLSWMAAACEFDCARGSNDPTIPINFTIRQVPEPASLALVTAALLAAGVAGRRRRRPPPQAKG